MLNGLKTYTGAVGLILVGLGGILAHKVGFAEGATDIALGIIAIGARSFGQKILDVLKASNNNATE